MQKTTLNLIFVLMIFGCSGSDNEPAIEAAKTSTNSVIGKRYLLSFLVCNTADTACDDPRNHKTHIAQSDDGINWSLIAGYEPHFGSVPDVIRRGDRLYVYTPGKVRQYSYTDNTWGQPSDVSIRHTDGTNEMFVDPSAIIDENGRLVLFYLVGQTSGDPARCPQGQSVCTKIIRSATEADGSDGTEFVVDPGNRAEIVITSSETASDPDIFKGLQDFILYVSKGAAVQALAATDLKGTYTDLPNLENGMLVNGAGGVPCGYYDQSSGEYWTYVHIPRGNLQVIRLAIHGSLDRLLTDSDFTDLISGSTFSELGAGYAVASPGFALNSP